MGNVQINNKETMKMTAKKLLTGLTAVLLLVLPLKAKVY